MSLRIVFMGTPEFAVASLEVLHLSEHEVVAVVTAPDRPAGRGRKLRPSAVKSYAIAANIPVLQPEKLRDETFLDALESYHADLFVVVAFRMLPELVWSMPSLGTINLHGSLLPQYRGAAPIHWAVINGEKETGCTTFLINEEIDEGGVLMKHHITIGQDETTGDIHDRMMREGAMLLLETVNRLENVQITAIPQSELMTTSELKSAPKIFKEDCLIDWQRTSHKIHDFIRGLSPFPGAYTLLKGEPFKVFRSAVISLDHQLKPGEILVKEDKVFVGCGKGSTIELLEIQAAGKKRMFVSDFLKGNSISEAQFD